MSTTLPRVDAFLSLLQEQRLFGDLNARGSILWHIDYYQRRAPYRRLAFRSSGFMILVLSISLPIITQLAPPQCQSSVVSAVTWLLAVIAATNSFFNWQKAWQDCVQMQLTLQFALSEWELRTVEARAATSDEEGIQILREALNTLMKSTSESVSKETVQYFEGIMPPDVISNKKG